jgi:hypothetical protein
MNENANLKRFFDELLFSLVNLDIIYPQSNDSDIKKLHKVQKEFRKKLELFQEQEIIDYNDKVENFINKKIIPNNNIEIGKLIDCYIKEINITKKEFYT